MMLMDLLRALRQPKRRSRTPIGTVAYLPSRKTYRGSAAVSYRMPMANGLGSETWGDYIRRLTKRKGWSVARLARESGFNPATLFEWMREEGGESVKAASIVAIAHAAGEDPMIGFRAAAGLTTEEPEDQELALVLNAELPGDAKDEIIASILVRRERDRESRMQDTIQMIRIAGGKVA